MKARACPRLFDWACLPIWHQGAEDGCHSVLLRRSRGSHPDLTFFLVFAPAQTSLPAKITALGSRWRIEEDFENSKDLGLDHYEVRSCVGWYRHITLVMLALAFLTSLALAEHASCSALDAPTELCPLSVPEVRHLLARLFFPAPSSPPLVLAWSTWRRQHQHRARFFHTRHRLKAG